MTPLPPIGRILAFLRRGGVIAHPTESCYGLGCAPRNAGAVTRILRLKARPRNKGLILIGSDCHQFNLDSSVEHVRRRGCAGVWREATTPRDRSPQGGATKPGARTDAKAGV